MSLLCNCKKTTRVYMLSRNPPYMMKVVVNLQLMSIFQKLHEHV